MTVNKDFKRLVRQRMQRTGESYTSARSKLLPPNYAKLAVTKMKTFWQERLTARGELLA